METKSMKLCVFLLDVACILCINIDMLKNEDCIKVGKNFMASSV